MSTKPAPVYGSGLNLPSVPAAHRDRRPNEKSRRGGSPAANPSGTGISRFRRINGSDDRLGHSSVRTTADINSHAIRGKDHAAALFWDEIMQRAPSKKPTGVNQGRYG